jgi:hypothetical protein
MGRVWNQEPEVCAAQRELHVAQLNSRPVTIYARTASSTPDHKAALPA